MQTLTPDVNGRSFINSVNDELRLTSNSESIDGFNRLLPHRADVTVLAGGKTKENWGHAQVTSGYSL